MRSLRTDTKIDVDLRSLDFESGRKILLGLSGEVYPGVVYAFTQADARRIGSALFAIASDDDGPAKPPVPALDGDRFITLARQFPTLRFADGLDGEFYPTKLDEWACNGSLSTAARHAARFVLHVYDSRRAWKSGVFNVSDARGAWDSIHRAAFANWFSSW